MKKVLVILCLSLLCFCGCSKEEKELVDSNNSFEEYDALNVVTDLNDKSYTIDLINGVSFTCKEVPTCHAQVINTESYDDYDILDGTVKEISDLSKNVNLFNIITPEFSINVDDEIWSFINKESNNVLLSSNVEVDNLLWNYIIFTGSTDTHQLMATTQLEDDLFIVIENIFFNDSADLNVNKETFVELLKELEIKYDKNK